MSLAPDQHSSTTGSPSRNDISPVWPVGKTAWPSQPTALLRRCDDVGGFSIATNKFDIGDTVNGLSRALSQLPAFGEHIQMRQRQWCTDLETSPDRTSALTQIRNSLAQSGVKLFEGISPSDWNELRKNEDTVTYYPEWHPSNSQVDHHPSSVPAPSQLQRSRPLQDYIEAPSSLRPSRVSNTGDDQTKRCRKRGAPGEYVMTEPKRQCSRWDDVTNNDPETEQCMGDMEVDDT